MDKGLGDNQRYVAEIVWLPTYIGVAVLVLGGIDNSNLATATMLIAVIGSRMVLELIYRLVFGPARLRIRTGIVAFVCQALAWGLIWWWYIEHRASGA
jgi:hypothetical protein